MRWKINIYHSCIYIPLADDVGSYDVPSPANSIVPAENTTDEKRLEDYEWV